MARYVRQTTVLLKLESTPGTDPTPVNTADALLVSNLTYPEFVANNVDRGNIKSYFGNNEQLVGTRYQTCGFDLELAGSGTAGDEAAWASALLCAAFAATDGTTYYAYNPMTPGGSALPSGTLYWFDCGVRHIFTYARGNVMLVANVGEIPKLRFTFTGLYNTLTDEAVPVPTLTAWTKPVVAMKGNTVLTIGATYSAGAISGGTAYCATAFELDLANQVAHTPMIGCETVEIADRAPRLAITLELTAAQEETFMADVVANTLRAITLTHGTAAGNIVLAHMNNVQLTTPRKAELNGLRLISFEGIPIPGASGNDEVIIVAK